MDTKNDGGAAFPFQSGPISAGTAGSGCSYSPPSHPGMSLRDYFAAQALTGLCSAHGSHGEWGVDKRCAEEAAGISYSMADAMIKARGE